MASSISNDPDRILIARLCLNFVDGPTAVSLTSICKDIVGYRYGRAKKETALCVACRKTVSLAAINTPCTYHPGLKKTWIRLWEDQYEGTMFSNYDKYDCCGDIHDGCKKAPQHNVTGKKCKNCGLIVDSKHVKGPCQFHSGQGAIMTTENWDCCKASAFRAAGCKIEPNHLFEVQYERLNRFAWSRLGTKAAVHSESRIHVLEFHEKSGNWTQFCILNQGYLVCGAQTILEKFDSSVESTFSYDATKVLISSGGNYNLVDIKTGTSKKITSSAHTDYFAPSWGKDNKYLFYLKASPDTDYGVFVLYAMDIASGKDLGFVNFTTSIPFNYDRPPKMDNAYLIPANFNEKRSFRHPDLASYIKDWIDSDSLRILEPYGNRMLFVTKAKKAVHYSFSVSESGRPRVEVLGTCMDKPMWTGIGNSLHAIQWIKTGFIALVQQNNKGTASYKRHKYEVWWFTDKLEKKRTVRLPKECRIKSKEMHLSDTVTLFKFDEATNQFFYAQQTKFFVLNDKLEVTFSMPWGQLDVMGYTYFNPRSRIAVYSANGLTAHIPQNPSGDVPKGYLFDEQFLSHDVKIYK